MARSFPATGHLVDMARSGHEHCGSWIRTFVSASSEVGASRTRRSAKALRSCSARSGSRTWRRSGTTRSRGVLRGARTDTPVVRYDRLGVGLSDRDLGEPASIDLETRVLEAVIGACRRRSPSRSSRARARRSSLPVSPAGRRSRSSSVVFFGSFVSRDDLPDVTRRSLVDFVRVNWTLAAQMLAGLIVPHASGDEIAALSRHKRRAADADDGGGVPRARALRRRAAVPAAA